jgi:predicted O-methyltransferase YrrM
VELRDPIPPDRPVSGSFEQAWALAEPVEGWMTQGQGQLLWRHAAALSPGDRVVEIGSYRGRSMIVLASAVPDGVELVAVDPHGGNDRGPQQWVGTVDEGEEDHQSFWANLERAGVAGRVRQIRARSQEAHDLVEGSVQLLYVDGAHGFRPALADVRHWGQRVAPGGVMLVHDCYSSIGVTAALLVSLTSSGGWRYLGRERSLAAWRREPVRGAARMANTGRQVVPLGWFARNVAVKGAIASGARPVARLLGSDGRTWPY